MTWILIVLASAGILLHGYISFVIPEDGPILFLLLLFVGSSLVYVIALLVARRSSRMLAGALIVAALSLALDLWVAYGVFIAPTSSTEALGLLFAPLINLIVILPAGLVVGWLISRFSDLPAGTFRSGN